MTTGASLVLSDPIPEAVATLDALFEYAAKIAPQQRIGGLDPGQSITFQELVDSGRALVRPLIAHGVTAGMPVIVPAGTASGFLPLLYAIAAAGAVIVPVRAQTTPSKMAAVVEDSGAGLVLAEDTVVPLLAQVLPDKVGTLALGDVTRESREAGTADGSAPAHRPEDLAVIQYTSGSTSNPRGVALTHRNVLSALRIIHTALTPRQADVIYHWLPLSHDMGLFGTLASLGAGIRVVISSPRELRQAPGRVAGRGLRRWRDHPGRPRLLLPHPGRGRTAGGG